jgi:D-beta-D-heptose 7-phosphate kinase/D-beta-D-heptose 1-phosphate adenosyltransferase
VILFAGNDGADAKLVDHVRQSALPLTMITRETDVMVWNNANKQSKPMQISTAANSIDCSSWPDYARMARAEIIALSAAIAGIPGVTIPMATLAGQISRFHPPLLQDTAGSAQRTSGKILPMNLLKEEIAREKAAGRTIVWTNGCFDIMHAGHATYLERAAALGDVLIVGLNSDASVKSTKGPNRPIVSEDQRARLMAALRCVDYIVIYDDDSPVELIRQLAPDIYAKGGDYNIDTINQPERRLMESLGGRIELLPGVPGISTSVIIKNVLKAYSNEASSK